MKNTLTHQVAELDIPTSTEPSQNDTDSIGSLGKEHFETWKYVDWFSSQKRECFVGNRKISEKLAKEGIEADEPRIDQVIKDLEAANLLEIVHKGNRRYLLPGAQRTFPITSSNNKDIKKIERDSLSIFTPYSSKQCEDACAANVDSEDCIQHQDADAYSPALRALIKQVSDEYQILLEFVEQPNLTDDDLPQLEKDLTEKIAPEHIRPCAVTIDKWSFPTEITQVSAPIHAPGAKLAEFWWKSLAEVNPFISKAPNAQEWDSSVMFFANLLDRKSFDELHEFVRFTFEKSWKIRDIKGFGGFESIAKDIWDEFLVENRKQGTVKRPPRRIAFPSHICADLNAGFHQAELDYAAISVRMAMGRSVGEIERKIPVSCRFDDQSAETVLVLNDPSKNLDLLTAITPRWIAASVKTGRFQNLEQIPDELAVCWSNGYLGRRVPFKQAVKRELALLTDEDIREFLQIVKEQFCSQLHYAKLVRMSGGTVLDDCSGIRGNILEPRQPLASWEHEVFAALESVMTVQATLDAFKESSVLNEYSGSEQAKLINGDDEVANLEALRQTSEEFRIGLSGKQAELTKHLKSGTEAVVRRMPDALERFSEALELLRSRQVSSFLLFAPKWTVVRLLCVLAQNGDITAEEIATTISNIGIDKTGFRLGKLTGDTTIARLT